MQSIETALLFLLLTMLVVLLLASTVVELFLKPTMTRSRVDLLAFLVMVLFTLVGWYRQRRRQRSNLRSRTLIQNGHCPTCSYDLRASRERCPECGNPIPHGNAYVKRQWNIYLVARVYIEYYRSHCEDPAYFTPVEPPNTPSDQIINDDFATWGFHFLGIVEFPVRPANSEVPPRQFCVYLHSTGLIAALARHRDREAEYVELVTELQNREFLETAAVVPTANSQGIPTIMGIHHSHHWGKPQIETLVAQHIEKLDTLSRESSSLPLCLNTLQEVCDSLNRSNDLRIAHHRKIGYIDRETFTALHNGELLAHQEEILHEIERQKAMFFSDSAEYA